MKAKPSLEEFQNGGGETPLPRPAAAAPAAARVNKTIRIRKAFETRLKEEAFRRTMEGSRVTESDIIDEALEKYFAANQ